MSKTKLSTSLYVSRIRFEVWFELFWFSYLLFLYVAWHLCQLKQWSNFQSVCFWPIAPIKFHLGPPREQVWPPIFELRTLISKIKEILPKHVVFHVKLLPLLYFFPNYNSTWELGTCKCLAWAAFSSQILTESKRIVPKPKPKSTGLHFFFFDWTWLKPGTVRVLFRPNICDETSWNLELMQCAGL